MDHGLSQLGLLVRMFDEVGLVDDIDQVVRFYDTPEHLIEAEAQLPLVIANFAEQQQIGFTQVGMGTVRIRGVVAEKTAPA